MSAQSPLSPFTKARDRRAKLKHRVKAELRSLIDRSHPGDPLPPYSEIANRLKCSLAPIRAAMGELRNEGRISLQRGRPAKVLWNNSFSESGRRAGQTISTTAVELAYRPPNDRETAVADEFGLAPNSSFVVCSRVRRVDGRPLAFQRTYVNPRFFEVPERFFLDHDVVAGSLSAVYEDWGFRPIRVVATLRVGEADETEQNLLSLPTGSPVLRSFQRTIIEHDGTGATLEVMYATYTREIEYTVERLPDWNSESPNE